MDVILPKLGMFMEEGVIVAWQVAEGQRVCRGDVLCAVETDKVDTEIEAEADGIVAEIVVSAGVAVPVGTLIAVLAEDQAALASYVRRASRDGGVEQVSSHAGTRSVSAAAARILSESVVPAESPTTVTRVRATPAARKYASVHRISLANVVGTGPRGMVTLPDVERADTGELPSQPRDPSDERVQRIRAAVAARLTESFAVPQFSLKVEVDAQEIRRAVGALNERAAVRITVTDILLSMISCTLSEHRQLNSLWIDGVSAPQEHVNAGLAVDTPAGLLVPVITDADRRTVAEIAAKRHDLVERARNDRLSPAHVNGGTWTLSNLGMFRVDSFNAILNPPQAAIVAVGRVAPRPWIDNLGKVVSCETLRLTVTVDHRAVDGAVAAAFIDDLASRLVTAGGMSSEWGTSRCRDA